MARMLILYHGDESRTQDMALFVREGVKAEGVEADIKEIARTNAEELNTYDGIIIGSPCYYGGIASEVKLFLDRTITMHGQLAGKVGGAFSSAANIGGGVETTVLDILHAFLIHGMVIQGDPLSSHYGPVGVNGYSSDTKNSCIRYGKRLAELVNKMN